MGIPIHGIPIPVEYLYLWTSTVVGHDVWSNRGSAARDMRRAPGSACARAKLSGSSTAKECLFSTKGRADL